MPSAYVTALIEKDAMRQGFWKLWHWNRRRASQVFSERQDSDYIAEYNLHSKLNIWAQVRPVESVDVMRSQDGLPEHAEGCWRGEREQ